MLLILTGYRVQWVVLRANMINSPMASTLVVFTGALVVFALAALSFFTTFVAFTLVAAFLSFNLFIAFVVKAAFATITAFAGIAALDRTLDSGWIAALPGIAVLVVFAVQLPLPLQGHFL